MGVKEMNKTKRKIAIITGASHPQDIGTAICRRLATDGVNVFSHTGMLIVSG